MNRIFNMFSLLVPNLFTSTAKPPPGRMKVWTFFEIFLCAENSNRSIKSTFIVNGSSIVLLEVASSSLLQDGLGCCRRRKWNSNFWRVKVQTGIAVNLVNCLTWLTVLFYVIINSMDRNERSTLQKTKGWKPAQLWYESECQLRFSLFLEYLNISH